MHKWISGKQLLDDEVCAPLKHPRGADQRDMVKQAVATQMPCSAIDLTRGAKQKTLNLRSAKNRAKAGQRARKQVFRRGKSPVRALASVELELDLSREAGQWLRSRRCGEILAPRSLQ